MYLAIALISLGIWDWCDNCNQFNSRWVDCDLWVCGVFVSYIDYIISI